MSAHCYCDQVQAQSGRQQGLMMTKASHIASVRTSSNGRSYTASRRVFVQAKTWASSPSDDFESGPGLGIESETLVVWMLAATICRRRSLDENDGRCEWTSRNVGH